MALVNVTRAVNDCIPGLVERAIVHKCAMADFRRPREGRHVVTQLYRSAAVVVLARGERNLHIEQRGARCEIGCDEVIVRDVVGQVPVRRSAIGIDIPVRRHQVKNYLGLPGNVARLGITLALDCGRDGNDIAVGRIARNGGRLADWIDSIGIVHKLRIFRIDVRVYHADFRPADADELLHHAVTGKPEPTVALAHLLVHRHRYVRCFRPKSHRNNQTHQK